MKKKNIMIITNSGVGLYSFRYELVHELIKQNYKVYLVYSNGDRKEEFESIGCKYINVSFDSSSTNPFKDLSLMIELKRVIKQYKPDAALLYTIKPCIYAGFVLRMMHIPYICTVTGVSPALVESNICIRTISKYLSRVGYNGSSIVYFQNDMNERMFSKLRIAPGKHKVISGSGVNLDKFSLLDYPEEDGCTKLIYLGRIKKIKGLEELANAVTKAVNNGLNIKCKIVGEHGDEIPALTKAIKAGIIEYEGPTDDVNKYIAWCNALVLPSYGEGMSNVLQEASASGRPVLASSIPGCKETFEQGVTGYGFKPHDSESLYKVIKAFHCLPYERKKAMGIKARKKMEKEFDRNKIVSIYSKRIKMIVGGR